VLDLACLADAATQTVDDAIETATTTTQQVVDQATDVTDPVIDTIVDIVDVVDDTVSEVVETVDPALGGVLPSPAPGGDPSGDPAEPGVAAEPGSTQPAGTVLGSDEGTGVVIVSVEGATDPSRPADGGAASRPSTFGETGLSTSPVPATGTPAGGAVSTDPTQIDVAQPGIREQAGFGFGNAAKRLAFPLVLALAVGVFLLAQHRFDRRAPKLALAPVEADVASFS